MWPSFKLFTYNNWSVWCYRHPSLCLSHSLTYLWFSARVRDFTLYWQEEGRLLYDGQADKSSYISADHISSSSSSSVSKSPSTQACRWSVLVGLFWRLVSFCRLLYDCSRRTNSLHSYGLGLMQSSLAHSLSLSQYCHCQKQQEFNNNRRATWWRQSVWVRKVA